MRWLANVLIKIYQRTLSGDHGPLRALFPYGVCRFYPSCSEYTRQAVSRYGVVCGCAKGVKRLSRCHPWGGSGNDPVE